MTQYKIFQDQKYQKITEMTSGQPRLSRCSQVDFLTQALSFFYSFVSTTLPPHFNGLVAQQNGKQGTHVVQLTQPKSWTYVIPEPTDQPFLLLLSKSVKETYTVFALIRIFIRASFFSNLVDTGPGFQIEHVC